MMFPLYDTYHAVHNDEHDDLPWCDECEFQPAAPWSILCQQCDNYFGGTKGVDRYNKDLEMENLGVFKDIDDSSSEDELDTSFNSGYSEW